MFILGLPLAWSWFVIGAYTFDGRARSMIGVTILVVALAAGFAFTLASLFNLRRIKATILGTLTAVSAAVNAGIVFLIIMASAPHCHPMETEIETWVEPGLYNHLSNITPPENVTHRKDWQDHWRIDWTSNGTGYYLTVGTNDQVSSGWYDDGDPPPEVRIPEYQAIFVRLDLPPPSFQNFRPASVTDC